MASEARVSRWYFGGLASCGAACCTHPLDLLKVRGAGASGGQRQAVAQAWERGLVSAGKPGTSCRWRLSRVGVMSHLPLGPTCLGAHTFGERRSAWLS